MDIEMDCNKFVIVNNQLVIITGKPLVEQLILQRLRLFLGEWFADTSVGVPYFQTIFVKGVALNTVSNILKDIVLQTPGVLHMFRFEIAFDSEIRKSRVSIGVRSAQGDIILSEVLA